MTKDNPCNDCMVLHSPENCPKKEFNEICECCGKPKGYMIKDLFIGESFDEPQNHSPFSSKKIDEELEKDLSSHSGSESNLGEKRKKLDWKHMFIKEHVEEQDKEFIKIILEDFIEDWKFCKKAKVQPYIHIRRALEIIKKRAGRIYEK